MSNSTYAGHTNSLYWSLYPYDPIKPLPIAFTILLLVISLIHAYQAFFKYQWNYYGMSMVWASSIWIAGFICRAYSQYHVQNIGTFVAQYVLILLGPPLFAVAVYSILSRLLQYLPYHAPHHPHRVISTFLSLSAAVEGLTAAGAVLSAAGTDGNPDNVKVGTDLVQSALLIQAVVELLFIAVVIIVELRCRKTHFPKHVRTVCYTLYITSFMMLVRCIVRAVDAFEQACNTTPDYSGYCGYVSTHEWTFWTFEVANITLFLVVLAVFPPGAYLPRDRRIFLDPSDARIERLGPDPGDVPAMLVLIKLLDPFDFVGLATGKGHRIEPFWQDEHPVVQR